MARRRLHHRISYFASSFGTVFGLVLIWRGIWYIMDWFDKTFFGGDYTVSVIGGIILGILVLYLPDRDLSELRKL
jgi:hypothetical protein